MKMEVLFVPSFDVDSPPDFFTSEEFKKKYRKIKRRIMII